MRYTWKTYAIKFLLLLFCTLEKVGSGWILKVRLIFPFPFSSFFLSFLFSHSFLSSFLSSFLFNFICCYCIYVYCVFVCACVCAPLVIQRNGDCSLLPSWHFKGQSNDPLLCSAVIKSSINKINDPLKILKLWLLVFPFSLPHFLPSKSWYYVS